MLSKKVMDQRFAEKMKALKEGRTPVFVAEAPVSSDPVKAADARIQEKLKRHYAKPEKATEAKAEAAKPEKEAEQANPDQGRDRGTKGKSSK
jgi:hypothetical protein